jgi:uncharacterized membrane protein
MFHGEELLLIGLVLALPILVIAAFVMSLSARGEIRQLKQTIDTLQDRLAFQDRRIDTLLARASSAAPLAQTPPVDAPEVPPDAIAAADTAGGERPSWHVPPFRPAGPTPPPLPSAEPAELAEPVDAGPQKSLEETIGTRWVVWVGGLALALGGIFLVRYSIEQGWLGPLARVLFGALFSAGLIGVGEWLRRREPAERTVAMRGAYIPGVLTAAGTIGAFATVYAAYALYGFLPPAIAFGALALVALATLAAAIVHGPGLAALGLIGAYVTPFLVASENPDKTVFAVYVLVVTAAALALARLRTWRWLALTTIAISTVFGVLIGLPLYALGLAALIGLLLVVMAYPGDAPRDVAQDFVAIGGLLVVGLMGVTTLGIEPQGMASRLMIAGFAGGVLLLALRYPAVATAAVVAAFIAGLATLASDLDIQQAIEADSFATGTDGLVVHRPTDVSTFLWRSGLLGAFLFVISLVGAHYAASVAPKAAARFVSAATLGATGVLAATWARVDALETSWPFAVVALTIGAVLVFMVEDLTKREPADHRLPSAVAAASAVAAIALSFSIGLERGVLTIALATLVPALAWIATVRGVPSLRHVAAVAALGVAARLAWDPRIVGDDLGAWPILNWLLVGYGIPALGTAFAAYTFRRTAADISVRVLEALAILFTVLFAVMQIRHLVHGPAVFTPYTALSEAGLITAVAFAMTMGLARIARGPDAGPVLRAAAFGAPLIATAYAVLALGFAANPAITGDTLRGPLLIDELLLGYGLPAVLAAIAAFLARGEAPVWRTRLMGLIALGLFVLWATFVVRRLAVGPILTLGPFGQGEQWAYSMVWLAIGVALLVGGLRFGSAAARLASAVLVGVTVLKVFLVDMSDLEGLMRALSFVGLGVTLIGIGLLYQRLLFAPSKPAPTQAGGPPPRPPPNPSPGPSSGPLS